MLTADTITRLRTGTVVEVLPNTGLAYVADGQGAVWTLTRSTRCSSGLALADLQAGDRLTLTIVAFGREHLVGHYAQAPGRG